MIPTCYAAAGELTSPLWCAAFAKGCGGVVRVGTDADIEPWPEPVALFGSPVLWRLLGRALFETRDWYYGDHGYFGRGRYYRCTRGALQHDGTGDAGPERFEAHRLEVKRWRTSGRHVVVCPPDADFAELMGFDANRWLVETLAALRQATDRTIMVRPRVIGRPLEIDLADAWALVTYMSNAAVDALIAGVPVIVTGPSGAARMGLRDPAAIETPILPDDREQFLWNLASRQWTIEEMERGDLWREIGR